MAKIYPFRAWRPDASFVSTFASVPYDVISEEEARTEIETNTQSFLRIVRPDAVVGENLTAQTQYALQAFKELKKNTLVQSKEPSYYVYRIKKDDHIQHGFFVCVDVDDYRSGTIVKHEKTKPEKVKERSLHIASLRAHAEPVMMAFEDSHELDILMRKTLQSEVLFSFTKDGETHSLWQIESSTETDSIFSTVGNIYITDGHHRCESAHLVSQSLGEEEIEAKRFPAVIFPFSQVRILPYNRVIKTYPNAFETLSNSFDLRKTDNPLPSKKGNVCVFFREHGWHEFTLPDSKDESVSQRLDYTRLQLFVLTPIFDIDDPRTNKNIDFVGGSRGTNELEKLVHSGKADVAFSLAPTSIEELRSVADAGELMPPKSTWFDPKVLSGLLIHEF